MLHAKQLLPAWSCYFSPTRQLLHASVKATKPAQSIFGDLTSADFSFWSLNGCITEIEIRIYHKLAYQTHKGTEFAPKQNLHPGERPGESESGSAANVFVNLLSHRIN